MRILGIDYGDARTGLSVSDPSGFLAGSPSVIHQEHCLHCGNCVEHCPVAAVIPREQETVPPET